MKNLVIVEHDNENENDNVNESNDDEEVIVLATELKMFQPMFNLMSMKWEGKGMTMI